MLQSHAHAPEPGRSVLLAGYETHGVPETSMRRIPWLALAVEAIAVVVFCVLSASSDYFVRMPASVGGGVTIPFMIGTQAVLLVAIFWAVNVMVLDWVGRIEQLQVSKSRKVFLSVIAGIAVLVVTCVLMVGLMLFTMPQY
jgi:hypothetical protein